MRQCQMRILSPVQNTTTGSWSTLFEGDEGLCLPMDQHIFVFATRGHCIKGKQCQRITIKNQNMSLCQNNLSYFPFMHCPLVANQKARLSIVKTIQTAVQPSCGGILQQMRHMYCSPSSFSPMPCSLQGTDSRWRHRSVCLVLTIEV